MKLRILTLLALLASLGVWTARGDGTPAVPASQADVYAGINGFKYITPKTLTGVGLDPLVLAYAVSNQVTDVGALQRLDRFCKRVRTMSSFTNWQVQCLFNQWYNPSNNLDLFGNPITWNGEPGFGWGAFCNYTNQGKITLPSQGTNWTVIVMKRNYLPAAQCYSYAAEPWQNEFSLENTNGDSFNFVFVGPVRNGYQFVSTYGGALACTNVSGNSFWSLGANGTANNPSEVPPALWTFEARGGNNVWGSQDAFLPFYALTTGLPNLMTNPNLVLSNASPVQVMTFGGSTNWNIVWMHNSLSGGADAPTNALCEIFSAAFFNAAISSNDLAIYYTAVNELLPSNKHWCQVGDSMLAEGNNYVNAYQQQGTLTNIVLFQFAQRHPLDAWHDWAQGGASLSTFTNNLSPKLITALPAGADVTLIEDFPRNDADTPGTINFAYLNQEVTMALTPWLATGAKLWQYESPLFATNLFYFFGTGSVSNSLSFGSRTNLYNAYWNLHTNTIFNRFLHGITYFSGSVWDTNNCYYAPASAGYGNAGLHIEGTNSPTFMTKMASYWDTGEWIDAMPGLGNVAGGYAPYGLGWATNTPVPISAHVTNGIITWTSP